MDQVKHRTYVVMNVVVHDRADASRFGTVQDLNFEFLYFSFGVGSWYALAFSTVGGEISSIPLYLFIENGWRIIPQAADHTLHVINGLLDIVGGGDPFVDPAGAYKIRIYYEKPGIAIGYSTLGGSVPSASDIADAVWAKVLS
jgi:hypothetical protein